jgi:hypothetical protein
MVEKKTKSGVKAGVKKPQAGATKAKATARLKWFDEKSGAPLIESYAKKLRSFMSALADGRVEESEVKAQEKNLVGLMKQVEPLLDDEVHAKVTELLCELTAYDLMQVLHAMDANRPRTKFRG